MAPRDAERTVQASVLDRLIDADLERTADPPATWAQSVRELKNALRRDLEWLLNTRRIVEPAPARFGELQRSLYHFGLPDITALSAGSLEARERLRRQVQEAITHYEPRLANVRVTVAHTDDGGRRELRFVVDGLLRMEPSPEQVVFDTVLEITSATFEVRGGGNA